MFMATFFIQECPTCGRRLRVRVTYLGKLVVCQHCRGRFEAFDSDSRSNSMNGSGTALLQRADDLLACADEVINRPR